MLEQDNIFDFFLDSIKKFLYPQDWLDLDLSFSKSELLALLLVDRNEEIIMSQIADYIKAPMSTATGVVERLVKNGCIRRDRSETDRRIVTLALTDKGREIVQRIKSTAMKYIGMVNDSLTDDERQVIFKIFTRVVNILEGKASDKEQKGVGMPAIKKIEIE